MPNSLAVLKKSSAFQEERYATRDISFSLERGSELRAKQISARNATANRMRQLRHISTLREARTSPISNALSLAPLSARTPREAFIGEQLSFERGDQITGRKGRRYKFFDTTMKFALGLALISFSAYKFAKGFLHLPVRSTVSETISCFHQNTDVTFTTIEEILLSEHNNKRRFFSKKILLNVLQTAMFRR
jgi:hypothetical protein